MLVHLYSFSLNGSEKENLKLMMLTCDIELNVTILVKREVSKSVPTTILPYKSINKISETFLIISIILRNI